MTSKIKIFLLIIIQIFLSVKSMANNNMTPPIAKKIKHETTIHGFNVVDEYNWLRDNNWPKVEKVDVLEYLNAENKYTEKYFAPYEKMQSALFEEMKGRIKEDDESYPVEKDGFFYYSKTIKDKNYAVSCRKKGSLQEKEEIILDANELSKGHVAFSMGAFAINPKHNLLAYSTDLEGEERYKIYVKNLDNNTLNDDILDNTIGNVSWHELEEGFFYAKLDDNWRSNQIFYHKLGTKQSEDILLFKEEDKTFSTNAYKSSDRKYLFIDSSSSTEDEVWYIDLSKLDFEPKLVFKRKKDLLYSIDHKNNDFYIKINDKGKNFRLINVPTKELHNQEKWVEIIEHKDDVYFTDFDLSKDFMVINRRVNGINQITVFDNAGNSKKINFDEESYTASGYFPTYESKLLRVGYSSLTTPASLYEYSFDDESLYLRKMQEIPSGYNKENYQSERLYAKASDGTNIPISIVYNKLKKSVSQPLYLYGYGSYGISIAPSFNANIISMLDRGFIFAIAHVRGGDDLGYKWYEDAKFLNKKLTFTDFISCSEYLINNKYTNADNLIISGGSAGGMLVTAVANARPELYKGVIARVPFVDVLNTMLDENLPLTPGEFKEWGNPKEKEYFEYIKSYSPYDNINKQNYPAMFITAGLADPRVTYWEPAKYTAKLRFHNTSNNPILLYTEMESGHQGQSGRYDSLKEIAKVYSFALSLIK